MSIASVGRIAAIFWLGLMAASAAHAVYRCGNVYQDRPCDDKGPQTHLTPGMKNTPAPGGTASPAAAAPSQFAEVCSRIGQDAQKVVWKREGGATQEKQMAELPNTGNRAEAAAIIESVYRKRGSAPEIRAAVEAECVAQKQQAADTAAAIRALQTQQAQQGGMAAAPASTAAPAASGAGANPPAAAPQKTSLPAGPSSSCPSWRSELDSINAEFRKGGSAARMEQLQNRRRDTEKSLRDGRC